MWSFFRSFIMDPQATPDDVNLLLLGETGVGKSTLINSISNYFIHSNFAKAQKGKVELLIPVCLNVSEQTKVYGKPDGNEVHEPGQSVTQNVKVYLFPIKLDHKTINLRLIDTPGVGDPRGIEQDNINLDNVLAYLATLKELHGICFVLKANQTRFTKFAEYCLKQILTRLDKSASQNIIFITTYSKTSSYTAGETKSHCLAPLVRSIRSRPPHVSIPLSDKNIFAVDNEGFKALLEIQDGTNYDRHAMKGFEQSWIKSTKEIQRLLKYIIGDSKHSALNPHDVENTVSINEVRFLIEQLTTLIAEVSELIQDNTRVLDKHARVHIEKTVNNENQRRTELEAERAIISKTIAKFACFLQEHALIPFNDLYSVYIKQRIKDETDLGKSADQQVITKFESMLKEHEQLQKTLQENPRGLQAASSHLTLEEIKNSVTELYNLKHMGKKIQELIKKSSNSRRKERQKKFRCTVEQEIILDKATVEDNDHKGHQSVSRNPKSRTQDDMHEKLIRISEIAKNDENFIQNVFQSNLKNFIQNMTKVELFLERNRTDGDAFKKQLMSFLSDTHPLVKFENLLEEYERVQIKLRETGPDIKEEDLKAFTDEIENTRLIPEKLSPEGTYNDPREALGGPHRIHNSWEPRNHDARYHQEEDKSGDRKSSDEDLDTKREKQPHRTHHKREHLSRRHRSSSERYDSDDHKSRKSSNSDSASSARFFDNRSSVKQSRGKFASRKSIRTKNKTSSISTGSE